MKNLLPLAVMKFMPMPYNKDMQEDKQPVFACADSEKKLLIDNHSQKL